MIKKEKKDKKITSKKIASKKLISSKQQGHIKKLPDGTIIDKRLYVELSKLNPNNVIMTWNNIGGITGFIFVLSDTKEEKLFAAGKTGNSEIPWIQNGKNYEFNFYGDAQKLNPIVRISLVKSANKLKQKTSCLK